MTRFTSKIWSIHFLASSISTQPRLKLFPIQNVLCSLAFPIFSLADAPLHLISCTQHTSTFHLDNALTTLPAHPLIVPTFKLPNLNFSSVSVVPDCRLTIWQCSGLTSALLCAGSSSVTPAHLILEQVLRLYALTNQLRSLEIQYFYQDTITRMITYLG